MTRKVKKKKKKSQFTLRVERGRQRSSDVTQTTQTRACHASVAASAEEEGVCCVSRADLLNYVRL